ncbi:MAG: hypothetical protein J0H14_13745 [Alphaproteobacteria bacterium]|nr:hypothetical protein [Alphaproteobacteria bacterium]
MAGVTKSHRKRDFGRAFPHSRYDDPRGGRPAALERNVLRYRAAESTLYLFYAEQVRDFMLVNVYPRAVKDPNTPFWETTEERRLRELLGRILSDAELAGRLSPEDAQKLRHSQEHDPKEGKKLRKAFSFAVDAGMFSAAEADELVELLSYRNDIAHRIHLVMSDVTRSYWTSDHVAFTAPTYKGDALDRLRAFKDTLWTRTRALLLTLSMDSLLFETAERIYEDELKRLDRLIQMQTRGEQKRLEAIQAELDLGSELIGDLHPRFPANHHNNGSDGGPATGHLTKRGVEICYRLFDMGKSPLAVSYIMGMSLRAAKLRQSRWHQAGGLNRVKTEVERYDLSPRTSQADDDGGLARNAP